MALGETASADRRSPADVTVSFTTTSRRIRNVHEVARSLLRQSVPPTRIVLWLSREPYLVDEGVRETDVPGELRELCGEVFQIHWTRNIGPYRKLLPAMEAFPGIIVTADDDTLYPSRWLADLLEMHRRHPAAVCCHRAHRMRIADDGSFSAYWRWPPFAHSEPTLDCFPTGKDGVLYPPGSLHEDVSDIARLMTMAPTNDDIWFKVMALRRGTRAIGRAGHSAFPVVSLPDQALGLFARYNLLGNDRTIADVMAAFGLSPHEVCADFA